MYGFHFPDSHGSPLPVRCYKQHDDSYWVEFTPENIGKYFQSFRRTNLINREQKDSFQYFNIWKANQT